ncbi:MAG: aspartate kinase [candidate division KSB1 bacterium]|jgi:aspartate kinase|nr:aspartate kinase [candidate division KSB1 bacterium]
MKVVVEKYGGTSLGSVERIKAVAEHVIARQTLGYGMVVVVSAMGDTTDQLLSMMKEVSHAPRQREMGMLLSTGEVVSCSLLAMAIQSMGSRATSLTGAQGGITTDKVYDNAKILNIDTSRIKRLLEAGEIIVVAGYQGRTGDDITVLGRGGSDASAVALAAVLGAEYCHIFSDVRGVYTADPRAIDDAALLDAISYEEMIELAGSGARVMMGRAVEIARKNGLKIIVSSSFEKSAGTIITKESELEKIVITGIASNEDVSMINIFGLNTNGNDSAEILNRIAEKQINIILLNSTRREDNKSILSLVVKPEDAAVIEAFLEEFHRDSKIDSYHVDNDAGLVSIVGSGIANHFGVAYEMLEELSKNDIDVLMTSTSEIKIAAIVPKHQTIEATHRLHNKFKLNNVQRNVLK